MSLQVACSCRSHVLLGRMSSQVTCPHKSHVLARRWPRVLASRMSLQAACHGKPHVLAGHMSSQAAGLHCMDGCFVVTPSLTCLDIRKCRSVTSNLFLVLQRIFPTPIGRQSLLGILFFRYQPVRNVCGSDSRLWDHQGDPIYRSMCISSVHSSESAKQYWIGQRVQKLIHTHGIYPSTPSFIIYTS